MTNAAVETGAPVETVAELVAQSREAQAVIAGYSQEQVDALVKVVGKVVFDNAEELARMAVDESRLGVYEDKILKNKGKSRTIWNNLKGVKSIGIIGHDEEKNLHLVAKPIGVVGAVTPCTNPVVTPMCNAMFALKGGNAIVVAAHPSVQKMSEYLVSLWHAEFDKLGAPRNLIQVVKQGSIEKTNELMKLADVVVATGGMAMVKAAYSSGKPSFGVGAGNVQCIFDRDIDFNAAAEKVVAGAAFDNGIICSSEQSVIAHEDDYDTVIEALLATGKVAYFDNPETVEQFRKALYNEDGVMHREVIGQSSQIIGQRAGVEIADGVRVILLKAEGIGREDVLCKEKLCSVLSTFKYNTFDEALHIAQSNLNYEGKGHSCSIHSDNEDHIKQAGLELTVSRLVVNQPSSLSAGGSFFNGFAPTTTLGCGSWGNNSISENLDWKHMVNISRVGLPIADAVQPEDEVIWA
ncbi:aldehyde dehydrogenase family protein [Porticoccus sp. W117]|uniref:aldehyde dehydrogenase family protein n=1 Tax=Porticoccus sp. W117 TaxID=3054777 RepID=UPI00259619D5|nr:aldehyde dehydrogenase family protein [Porticoccus sp. W117]MDM3870556.1 aldehyde dehydrogenase family protein [Porticoccus sp. W117]